MGETGEGEEDLMEVSRRLRITVKKFIKKCIKPVVKINGQLKILRWPWRFF
jgi:hypothetical protein